VYQYVSKGVKKFCGRRSAKNIGTSCSPWVNFTNILRAAFAPISLRRYLCAKKVQTFNLITKKLRAKLSYEKAARKMLVKLFSSLTQNKITDKEM
jgi:hypothetical protein